MPEIITDIELLEAKTSDKSKGKLFIESYGCQMNFSDSEIVASVLKSNGFDLTQSIEEADLIFLNTCSVCCSMFPGPTMLPAGSTGTCPDM